MLMKKKRNALEYTKSFIKSFFTKALFSHTLRLLFDIRPIIILGLSTIWNVSKRGITVTTLKVIRARDDNARSHCRPYESTRASEQKTSSERNLGCESIDSCHAIIKMCTAYFHISLARIRRDFISGAFGERRKRNSICGWCGVRSR